MPPKLMKSTWRGAHSLLHTVLVISDLAVVVGPQGSKE